jgi:UDPglucose 6-dehydrogenase
MEARRMEICIVGAGYVGLVTGACLAEMGNHVICVDEQPQRVADLQAGKVPIYEPGLEELVLSNANEGRFEFTTDLADAVRRSTICMIAVGTPPSDEGEANLSSVFAAAEGIARAMDGYRIITTKSTVPVGTTNAVKERIAKLTSQPFSVVSNPEFLKQGDAINDFLKPSRVVLGTEDARAYALMQELYAPFLRTGAPILMMDIRSSEMTKYAANAFLATKISFINEIAGICEAVGADVADVCSGLGTDPRIGSQFLFPGVGFGGSCLPKDIRALQHTAGKHGAETPMLLAVERTNKRQPMRLLQRMEEHFGGSLKDKRIAVWGLSFKPRTDDIREAPSLTIVEQLLERGAAVQAYDPRAMTATKARFPAIQTTEHAYDALNEADALVILTEWNEFRRPNYDRIKSLLKQPVIFDGRNLFDPKRMAERGFNYYSVGRPTAR